ncbi:hypothetical protein [Carnobacterium alterfunditum]|uniref:hypothetical protein n=1 Tax=Carnobacterium alterfunditum TaxID=28230 RepID=UPI003594290F
MKNKHYKKQSIIVRCLALAIENLLMPFVVLLTRKKIVSGVFPCDGIIGIMLQYNKRKQFLYEYCF